MKLLDVEWGEVVDHLDVWRGLPRPARRTLLDVARPSLPGRDEDLGEAMSFLLSSTLVSRRPQAGGWIVPQGSRAFVRTMQALDRYPVFDTAVPLDAYLRDHFSHDERISFSSPSRFGYRAVQNIEHLLGSVGWLRGFEGSSAAHWEREHLDGRSESYFAETGCHETALSLLRGLIGVGGPVPLGELSDLVGEAESRVMHAAIRAMIRYCLCFPALRQSDLLPVVGIWPDIQREMSTPPPPSPPAVVPGQTFHAPLLVHDMVVLITECMADPLRLRRGDGGLFARTTDELAERLQPVPRWCGEKLLRSPEARIREARRCAEDLGLLRAGVGTKEPRIHPTGAATEWLAASPLTRLGSVIRHISESRGDMAPPGDGLLLLGHDLDLRSAVRQAFAGLPLGGFVSLDAFIAYHATQTNPYLDLRRRGKRLVTHIGAVYREPSTGELHEHWAHWLEWFVVHRLFALDGIAAGLAEDGEVGLSLSDVGRYILGMRAELAGDEEARAEIVVQPNFEVVFLSPDPYGEGVIGRFAERAGEGVGVLFRITRNSVYRAAASGLTADRILAQLGRLSVRQVPVNVAREIEGWHGECRRVEIDRTYIIRCSDPQTSGRIIAALGPRVEAASDTVVVLRDVGSPALVRRKLQEHGIFVDEGGTTDTTE